MKTSTKMLVGGLILAIIPIPPINAIGFVCFIAGLAMTAKNFLFELIDHIKGNEQH